MGVSFSTKSEKSEYLDNHSMKLFPVIALASAAKAYTVFEVGNACDPTGADETKLCVENEMCDEASSTCVCMPGYGPEKTDGKDCTVFTCADDLCNGQKCKDNACDCSGVEECKVEGACDAYCAVIPVEPTEAPTEAPPTEAPPAEDSSVFATVSALAMAMLFA